jgi:hypothetical protein
MLVNEYRFIPIRDAAILTNSYVAGNIIGVYDGNNAGPNAYVSTGVGLLNQLIIYVDFTKGSLTTGELIVEFSNDKVDWYQEGFDSAGTPSGGAVNMGESIMTRQFSANFKGRIAIPIKDQFIRISAKGTGTVTSSSMKIDAIVGI